MSKARFKAKLFFRERGKCFYCSRSLNIKCATFDHIIPRSKGGGFYAGNLVIACLPCNGERGDGDAAEFLRRKMNAARQS